MASNINPNTIDTGYPIAGQDNDSQGFRDNFTNTKTNFDSAKAEIEDLQNHVVLKSPLEGSTEGVDNDFNGTIMTGATMVDMRQPITDLTWQSNAVATIDASQTYYFNIDSLNEITIDLSFINFIPGQVTKIILDIDIARGSAENTDVVSEIRFPSSPFGLNQSPYYNSDGGGSPILFLPRGRFIYEMYSMSGDESNMVGIPITEYSIY